MASTDHCSERDRRRMRTMTDTTVGESAGWLYRPVNSVDMGVLEPYGQAKGTPAEHLNSCLSPRLWN